MTDGAPPPLAMASSSSAYRRRWGWARRTRASQSTSIAVARRRARNQATGFHGMAAVMRDAPSRSHASPARRCSRSWRRMSVRSAVGRATAHAGSTIAGRGQATTAGPRSCDTSTGTPSSSCGAQRRRSRTSVRIPANRRSPRSSRGGWHSRRARTALPRQRGHGTGSAYQEGAYEQCGAHRRPPALPRPRGVLRRRGADPILYARQLVGAELPLLHQVHEQLFGGAPEELVDQAGYRAASRVSPFERREVAVRAPLDGVRDEALLLEVAEDGEDGSRIDNAVAAHLYELTDPAKESFDAVQCPGPVLGTLIAPCAARAPSTHVPPAPGPDNENFTVASRAGPLRLRHRPHGGLDLFRVDAQPHVARRR